MRALVKEPGKAAEIKDIKNDLKELQGIVKGYIETVTITSDAVVICNEEGRLLGLPHNCEICGVDFVGTIVLAGVKGDELTDFKWTEAEIEEVGLTIGGGKTAEKAEAKKEQEGKKRRALKEMSEKERTETAVIVDLLLNKLMTELLKLADEYGLDRNELLEKAGLTFLINNKGLDFTDYKIEEDADEEV